MNVLLVEDDPKLLAMLERMYKVSGYEVATASSVQSAQRQLGDTSPDLLVIDWNLPDKPGIELVEHVRQSGMPAGILMLTARDAVGDRVIALDSGADDYLVKPFAFDELKARSAAILRRTQKPNVIEYADLTIDEEAHRMTRGDRVVELGKIEWQLCSVLAEQAERVCSRSTLYLRVWGHEFAAGSNTLDVHMGTLRKKLEAEGETRLIHTVRGFGYVMKVAD